MGKDLQFVNPASVRMPSWGFYARDQWQINKQAHAELRHALRATIRSRRGRTAAASATTRSPTRCSSAGLAACRRTPASTSAKGRSPRVSALTYRLAEQTVVRAGYGISIDPNSFRNLRDAYPATISSQFSGASIVPGGGIAAHGYPGGPAARSQPGHHRVAASGRHADVPGGLQARLHPVVQPDRAA